MNQSERNCWNQSMKRIREITKILNDKNFNTKIKVYMSTKTKGAGYNPYEENYIFGNLNPITVKGYVRQLSPESLVYRMMGTKEVGSKSVFCDAKYKKYFELSNKIEIGDDEFEIFKEGNGRCMITDRPYKMINIVLKRK